jgi:hypothetical protein
MSEVRKRQPEPGTGVSASDALLVGACVEPEDVRNPRRDKLPVECQVLCPETGIAPADVKPEERRVDAEGMSQADDGVVQVRATVAPGRAEV